MDLNDKHTDINKVEVNVDNYEEDIEWYDPKAEYERDKNFKEEMEDNDILALFLAGLKVLGPFIIIPVLIVIFISMS